MNSLFMELSENKQFSTRVSLLRALDISNQPLSIKELSHSLGVYNKISTGFSESML